MLMIMTNLEDQVLGVQGKAIELQLGWEDWLLRSDPVISIEIRQKFKVRTEVGPECSPGTASKAASVHRWFPQKLFQSVEALS